jgi:hypothetical protein
MKPPPFSFSSLSSAEQDLFEERAGVLEYEAGLSRDEAEQAAFQQVLTARFSSSASGNASVRPPEARSASLGHKSANVHGQDQNKAVFGVYEGIEGIRLLNRLSLPVRPFNRPGKHSRGQGADGDPLNYSLDAPLETGQPYKVFIKGKFLVLDIDRHEGKPDGVFSLYQWLESIGLDRPDLPFYMQVIAGGSFPLYTATETGLHLFFTWKDASKDTPKSWHLCDEVEVKTETIREGYNGGGKPRILRYNNNPPPLAGLILDKILEKQAQKASYTSPATAPQSRPQPQTSPRRPYFPQYGTHEPLILEKLAAELPAGLGHHDAQVRFAGKCARLFSSYTQKGFFSKAADFDYSAALAYIKTRPDLFGADKDTAAVVKSLYKGV